MSSEFPTLVLVGRQEQNYYKKPFSFHFFIKIFVATLLPQRWKTLLHCHSSIPGDGKHCYIVTLYTYVPQVANGHLFRVKTFLDRVVEARQA